MEGRSHSPQDQLYGPLSIPSYCWGIIDTPEFQRLRYILQLGCVVYVFPGANHTRFEHSLGCAHLASQMIDRLQINQPELCIEIVHKQALVIGALCHDLGHGPYSHLFESVVHNMYCDVSFSHENMSCQILKYIVKKYNLPLDNNVIEAACGVIRGKRYGEYPEWLFSIVANHDNDIDIDKFDYLSRDMNRTLNISRFEYDRLIFHCRITDGKLSWRLSEIPTIERLFFNRNDMHHRVYKHRVVISIGCMVADILQSFFESLDFDIEELLSDPSLYCKYDDRIMYLAERGEYGAKAMELANDIKKRNLYRSIGELIVSPDSCDAIQYSQKDPSRLVDDIAQLVNNLPPNVIRVVPLKYRYGLSQRAHPLLQLPFWKDGVKGIIQLRKEDISCIVPNCFAETWMRVFVTDPKYLEIGKVAFMKWKESKYQN